MNKLHEAGLIKSLFGRLMGKGKKAAFHHTRAAETASDEAHRDSLSAWGGAGAKPARGTSKAAPGYEGWRERAAAAKAARGGGHDALAAHRGAKAAIEHEDEEGAQQVQTTHHFGVTDAQEWGPNTRLKIYSKSTHKEWKPRAGSAAAAHGQYASPTSMKPYYLGPTQLNTPGIQPHEVEARQAVLKGINAGAEEHNAKRRQIAAYAGPTKKGQPRKPTGLKKTHTESMSPTLTTIRDVLTERNWIHIDKSKVGKFNGRTEASLKAQAGRLKGHAHTPEKKKLQHEVIFALRAKEDHGIH